MPGLYTDLYQIRMAASYLRREMTGPATFSLFVRDLPADRGFLVAAGLAECLDFLETFRFTDDELDYLADAVELDQTALAELRRLRFTGDVWAVPEGRMVFAGEPLLEVTAPIAEAQLVETALLNLVTFATTVATKAARCRLAAGPADVVDFAFRRTQGIDAAMTVARVSAIVGFSGTSNVAAARRYGLRPVGTMAHSYVEAFPDEVSAFRAFARDFPAATVFLVDTYDTLAGVRAAIQVAADLGLRHRIGVRLDSGDLATLAAGARRLLDEAGLPDAQIVASGSLDEYRIADLVALGAPIDVYGVGTRMGVSADAPYLDTAYKLVCFGDRPVMKLSTGKVTSPGAKQVLRGPEGDVIALRDEPVPHGYTPLLQPVMRHGRLSDRRLTPYQQIIAARQRFHADLDRLGEPARRLRDPAAPQAVVSERLAKLTREVRDRLWQSHCRPPGDPVPAAHPRYSPFIDKGGLNQPP